MPEVVTLQELNEPTNWNLAINQAQRDASNTYSTESPSSQNDYIRWQTENAKDYDNFMRLTLQPQNNPFGIAGNPLAMKKLELQGPLRASTENNPFMNVDIHEYGTEPKYSRSPKKCGKECETNFYKNLFQTPSDYFWKRQASERQFYTMPNTSVPNEQKKFAEWLYGKNYVGKTGSIYNKYGYPYTPDSLVNTGFNAASAENAGQVNNNYGTPITRGASPWVNNPNYGYGFGGLPGGIPFHNLERSAPNMHINPMPMFPGQQFPDRGSRLGNTNRGSASTTQTVPAGLF